MTRRHGCLRQHLHNVAKFGYKEVGHFIVLPFGHQLAYIIQVMDAGAHEKRLHASSTAHQDVGVQPATRASHVKGVLPPIFKAEFTLSYKSPVCRDVSEQV